PNVEESTSRPVAQVELVEGAKGGIALPSPYLGSDPGAGEFSRHGEQEGAIEHRAYPREVAQDRRTMQSGVEGLPERSPAPFLIRAVEHATRRRDLQQDPHP